MKKYTITGINQETGAVYAEFVYGDRKLNETVFPESLLDKDIVTSCVENAFNKFVSDIDALSETPTLPQDVDNLIGESKEIL